VTRRGHPGQGEGPSATRPTRPGRAGRLGRRAKIASARVLGYLAALAAVIGVVTLVKGSPGVGGLMLLAAFVLVAIAYAFVRSVNARSRVTRRGR
jgi:hypothetical protein